MIFPKNVTFICMFQKKSVPLQFVRREKHILTRRTTKKHSPLPAAEDGLHAE